MEDAAGEQPGGPRQGSDFQNLHRNKRAMTINLKDPKGLDVFRRHRRELPPPRQNEARHALINVPTRTA
jgi:crotonobetainyl-CoA:carnitine CoA-transferase CaiB-like acyl-CoA transferase